MRGCAVYVEATSDRERPCERTFRAFALRLESPWAARIITGATDSRELSLRGIDAILRRLPLSVVPLGLRPAGFPRVKHGAPQHPRVGLLKSRTRHVRPPKQNRKLIMPCP